MKRYGTYHRARKPGFTLLEILLVVGLLALLASIAIPALSGQAEKAKINMVKGVIGPNGTLSQALENYQFDIGSWPDELKYLIEKPSDSDAADQWTSKYIEDASGLQDPWHHDFQYQAPGSHHEDGFDLWSLGPDGIDGTEDDIKNWKDDR
ncbi:MAG: type II secretion system major pseudopilin GspG [Phycisphaerae bacterium]